MENDELAIHFNALKQGPPRETVGKLSDGEFHDLDVNGLETMGSSYLPMEETTFFERGLYGDPESPIRLRLVRKP